MHVWKSKMCCVTARACEVEDFLSEEAGLAAKSAAAAFKQHGDAVRVRLDKGGFTAEQVLGGWFPEAEDGAAHAAHR